MKTLSDEELRQGLIEGLIIQRHPNSKRADAILTKLVQKNPRIEHIILATAGLMEDRKWPLWMRLLQIRYVKLVCKDKPAFRKAVKEAVKTQSEIDEILKVVVRCTFLEEDPKTFPREYWDKAVADLQKDVTRWRKKKTTPDETTAKPFQLFGAEYGLSPIEWMSVSDD